MAHPEENAEKNFKYIDWDNIINMQLINGKLYLDCDDVISYFINQKDAFENNKDLREYCNELASVFIQLKARNR